MQLYELFSIAPTSIYEEIFSALNNKQRRAMMGQYTPHKSSKFVSLKTRQAADPSLIFGKIVEKKENLPLEELMRAWFLKKQRSLLSDALDWAGIPHEDGVTNDELDAITKAPLSNLEELVTLLIGKEYPPAHVLMYLAAIGCDGALHVDALRQVVIEWGGEDMLPKPGEEADDEEDGEEESAPEAEEAAGDVAEEETGDGKVAAE